MSRAGLSGTIVEVEGPFRPTLLINGIDVTSRAAGQGPSCRLDLPEADQILAALQAGQVSGATGAF
jgi:hypothetical protein